MIRREPERPKILTGCSILGLPACETRSTPEELLGELMGEIFYSDQLQGNLNDASLRPDNPKWLDAHNLDTESFVLNAGRGRFVERRQKNAKSNFFFAPLYPSLVSGVPTVRKSGSRIIRRFLIEGVWAHGFANKSSRDQSIKDFSQKVVSALLGKPNTGADYVDLLFHSVERMEEADVKIAIQGLERRIADADVSKSSTQNNLCSFPSVAVDDFLRLCELEKHLPRPLWSQLLMAYLRIVIPIWALSFTTSMDLFYKSTIAAMGGFVKPEGEILNDFQNRMSRFLNVSTEHTRSLRNMIEKYQCQRVSMFEFCHRLEKAEVFENGEITSKRKLTVLPAQKTDEISMHEFLNSIRSNSSRFESYSRAELAGLPSQDWFEVALTRWSRGWEGFQKPAADNPKTAGTNLRFLMNCARSSAIDDGRGSHLFEVKYNPSQVWRLFPGPLATQLFVFFADKGRVGEKAKRRLLLRDLLQHFELYGFNTSSEEAKTGMVQSLSSLGLLAGSPDAGSSLALKNPFPEHN